MDYIIQIITTRTKMTIGTRIKNKRFEKQMSQKDLAAASEIAKQHLCRIEHDAYKTLHAGTAWRIAKALDVSIEYLLSGKHNEAESKSA